MYHLLRKQVILLCFLMLLFSEIAAQKPLHREDHDEWSYYFGMTLGYNRSFIQHTKHPKFLADDSVLVAEPGVSGGIALGLMATMRFTPHLEARANPQLILGASRFFTYDLKYPLPGESTSLRKNLPTTIVSFPFQLKFRSDRIGNFRTYLLGGLRYDFDLSSSASARNAEDLIKLKSGDFGVEYGIGFNFYLPFVTVSPEIKFSTGLSNLHSRDANLKFSSVFDKLMSRMIAFSIHLED